MVKVRLSGTLRAFADDRAEVEIEAKNLRGLLDGLAAHYPGMTPFLERGVTVAIDGLMYNDAWFTPINPESEVYVLNRLTGG